MNCIIPFTKDIKFKTNICEILSISLENEYTLNDEELLGNFIVTGEYKSHEVSVNKEKFEHVLPFSVTLTTKINPESLDFNIEDFTYEVIDKNTLRVNIEYSVKAEDVKKEEEESVVFENVDERKSEEDFENILEKFETKHQETSNEEKEKIVEVEPVSEDKIEEKVALEDTASSEPEETMSVQARDSKPSEEERPLSEDEQETVINNVNIEDNTFVTYHIHIMKDQDTIDTVCNLYNINSNVLGEYNDLANVNAGDKLIIPDIDE